MNYLAVVLAMQVIVLAAVLTLLARVSRLQPRSMLPVPLPPGPPMPMPDPPPTPMPMPAPPPAPLTSGPDLSAIWEVLARRDDEWVHNGWVRQDTLAWQRAQDTSGLALRRQGAVEIQEGVQ